MDKAKTIAIYCPGKTLREATTNLADDSKETKISGWTSQLIPNSSGSDVSGEVIKILREDGDPVGYGDALIALLPSFLGIKKLQ
ncbi:hypothetical protein CRYUN_Cryun37aG0025900 [Craigia yunnanensis]